MSPGSKPEVTHQITLRFNKNLAKFNDSWARPYRLSLSLGLAHFEPDRPRSLDELMDQADRVLYEDRRLKGAVDIFKPSR